MALHHDRREYLAFAGDKATSVFLKFCSRSDKVLCILHFGGMLGLSWIYRAGAGNIARIGRYAVVYHSLGQVNGLGSSDEPRLLRKWAKILGLSLVG